MGAEAGNLSSLSEWLNWQCLQLANDGGIYFQPHLKAPFLEASWEYSRRLARPLCFKSTIEPEDVAYATFREISKLMPHHATVLVSLNIKYSVDLRQRTNSNFLDLTRAKRLKIKTESIDEIELPDSKIPHPDVAIDIDRKLRRGFSTLSDEEVEVIWAPLDVEDRMFLQQFLEGRPKLDLDLTIQNFAKRKGRSVAAMYRRAAAVREKLIRMQV